MLLLTVHFNINTLIPLSFLFDLCPASVVNASYHTQILSQPFLLLFCTDIREYTELNIEFDLVCSSSAELCSDSFQIQTD